MSRDKTKLTEAEIEEFLRKTPTWKRKGEEIERTYELPTFPEAIQFVNRVAQIAEANDHHPDIDIRWRKVTLRLTTHDAGGLTWRDTKSAAEFDAKERA